jgi:hypothetical protein
MDQATETVAPVLDQATKIVAPLVDQATKTVAPILDQATKTVAPVLDQATKTVAPVVDVAISTAAPVVQATKPAAPIDETAAPRDEHTATSPIAAPVAESPAGARHLADAGTAKAEGDPPARVTTMPTRDEAVGLQPVDDPAATPRTPRRAATQHVGAPPRERPATTPATQLPTTTPAVAAFTPPATTNVRDAQPATPPANDVAPTAPSGGFSTAAASAGSSGGVAAFAILFFLLLAPCLRYGRVRLAPAHWRPVSFVSLLERPG